MRGVHLIDGAGHWLEQEQPEQVSKLLEPLAKLQWCDEFSTGMSGKRGVRGVLG